MSESQARQGLSETLLIAVVAIVGLVLVAVSGILCGRISDSLLTIIIGLIGVLAGAGGGAAVVYGKARGVLQKKRKEKDNA